MRWLPVPIPGAWYWNWMSESRSWAATGYFFFLASALLIFAALVLE